ncbi:MAG: primosomal protein N' [Nitrospira bacterium HGW-Nitrospira-1]|nr:MAG: primosomal protein N' [Nitrospira bacterium HGW-Nitrospira-1]
MIKFFMQCFDVLFPINLGPLTYICPESLSEIVQPGLVIQAPLKNKLTRGIVLGKNSSPPSGTLKELQVIPGEPAIVGKSMLKLILWMSDYYIASEGLVLKQTLPGELFSPTQPRKGRKKISLQSRIDFLDIASEDVLDITAAINSAKYTGFLLHAPSLLYEYSMVSRLLQTTGNIIVLLPDIAQANLLHDAFKDMYAERLCLLHGELSRGKRSEYIEGIISGRHDIVIGTRAALFAPLKKVSLIMVLNEHSRLYKIEEGIRYNMRDAAVMRGFMEKAAVLLSSISPSIDSYFNAITNKYRLVKPSSDIKRPAIRIADMRFEKKIKPDLSKTVFDAAQKHIKKNDRVMFVINRRGYSSLLLCNECGYIEKCHACNIHMTLHKNDNLLKCHHCNKIQPVPERCPRCKSHNFELLGSGTQRVQEYIEELFGMATMRFDSDNVKKKSEKEELSRLISGDFSKILIGTKLMTGRIMVTDKYSMAAVLNIDSSLNLPDFRAMEKAYQELSSIIDVVESKGEVLIQTRFSRNPLFKHLRLNDYSSFAKEELSLRKSLGYPPYAKLLNITFRSPIEISERIMKIIRNSDPKIEMLGPTTNRNKKGIEEFSIILKSADRKALNTAARKVLKTFDRSKKIQIRIDVDPA